MKFSVIIPVCNIEEYLRECLDNIINQTFTDFEVICINDGSSDNSGKILQEYASKDERFVIINQENQGTGASRNNALKIAHGEYVVFVDSDDWLELNALEKLHNAFNVTKAEVLEFDYYEYNHYSGKTSEHSLSRFMRKNFNYDLKLIPYYDRKICKSGCLHRFDLHVWRRAYSLEFLKKAGAVFSPTKQGEDHLFAIAVLLNAPRIFYLDQYLYNYRVRTGSATNSVSDNSFDIFKDIQLLQDYLITHNFYNELKNDFELYKVQSTVWHYEHVPYERLEEYKSECRELLTAKEYRKMLAMTKRKDSPLEFLFSLKNEKRFGVKYKVITVLGFKIKIKPKEKGTGGIAA